MMKTHRLFTNEECDQIITEICDNNTYTYHSRQYGNEVSSYNKIELKPDSWFYFRVKKYIDNELNDNLNGTLIFLNYKSGDKFPMHIDKVTESEYHRDFIYNVNVILNDDYDGGEFVINNQLYKEPSGTIYYYKSDIPHGVNEITSGNRYVLLYHIRDRDYVKKKLL